MPVFLLYIDPGTGSMLFSVLIGAAAAFYFFARALLIKAKVFFSGGAAAPSAKKPYAVYCEGSQYWAVFKPVLDEFEARRRELLYLSSAEDDPAFTAGYAYVKPEYIGAGNKAFARLNLLSAGVLLMTTPGLGVYQLKRSKGVAHYAHILHAPGDATMYRLFGLDYFDSVLLTGEYQKRDIRELERRRGLPEKRLVVTGCSYLDVYAESIRAVPAEAAHPFTVLLSPSWGPSALLSRYGSRLLDPLARTGWRIIARPHPQSKKSEAAMLAALEARYKDAPNVVWDYERDNVRSLAKADAMISDFSGIIFDYAFLRDKPVFYVNRHVDLRPYDADDICSDENGHTDIKKLWQFAALERLGIELKEEMFPRIAEAIRDAADSEDLRKARHAAREEAWMRRGEAGKRTADFMMSVA